MELGHDFTVFMVTGDLTESGLQYSTEVEITTKDTDTALFLHEFELGYTHVGTHPAITYQTLLWNYFKIAVMLKVSAGTATMKWKPQARNHDGTWIDLCGYISFSATTAYQESRVEGYAGLTSDFNQIPFDFRILFQCDADTIGKGKVKNTTQFRSIFKDIVGG